MSQHPLIETLRTVEGNAKPCIWTEPLWGIPYHLIMPYASLYMATMGVSSQQIGLIASIGVFVSVITALLSGPLTDKAGRRMALLVSDLLTWGVACIIWAFAQSFWWFVAAALFNTLKRVGTNSWNCLLVEGTPEKHISRVWTLVLIMGQVAVFFAPIAGLMVARLTLVPTMRILYAFFAVLMVIKTLTLYFATKETPFGQRRMQETRNRSIFSMVLELKPVFMKMLKNRSTVFTLALLIAQGAVTLIADTFLALYATQYMGVPEAYISIFPILTSVAMLAVYGIASHRFSAHKVRRPLLVAFVLQMACFAALVLAPSGAIVLTLLCVLVNSVSLGILMPLMEIMTTMHVDPNERARIMGMLHAFVQLFVMPFGYISGIMYRAYSGGPFLLLMLVAAAGALLAIISPRVLEAK